MRYESRVIHEMAERMYSVAATTEIVTAIIGVALFGVGGFLAGSAIEQPIVGLAFGVAIGAAIGYFIGHRSAMTLRFQAQLALCQVQIEENTRTSRTESPTRSSSARTVAGTRIGNALGQ